jgi:hypothetical protein
VDACTVAATSAAAVAPKAIAGPLLEEMTVDVDADASAAEAPTFSFKSLNIAASFSLIAAREVVTSIEKSSSASSYFLT